MFVIVKKTTKVKMGKNVVEILASETPQVLPDAEGQLFIDNGWAVAHTVETEVLQIQIDDLDELDSPTEAENLHIEAKKVGKNKK
jgi:hypothetical protein